jgi:hypothetical protein
MLQTNLKLICVQTKYAYKIYVLTFNVEFVAGGSSLLAFFFWFFFPIGFIWGPAL